MNCKKLRKKLKKAKSKKKKKKLRKKIKKNCSKRGPPLAMRKSAAPGTRAPRSRACPR